MRAVLADATTDKARPWSMPAPIGGWNTRDNLAAMPSQDAVFLDNWWPGTTSVDVRQGSVTKATLANASETIQSLLGVAKGDGTVKLFAAGQSGFWDVTPGGAIAAVAHAASNAQWQWVSFEVGGVYYLWACCGDSVNKVRLYNSNANTWLALDGASTPAITGIPDTTKITNVLQHKFRLMLCYKDSLSFWYGPLNSVGGAFSEFPLGTLFTKGGYLVAAATWTIDGGQGQDDLFVAITSEGEACVYKGTDPSAAATWVLQGVYQIGRPIGKRCFMKLGADLAILTERGLFPLSKALQSDQLGHFIGLTDKIDTAFNTYFNQFGTTYGWQVKFFPNGPAAVVNVPLGNNTSYQFVMNTITGAWARFLGWNADTMEIIGGKLYFAMKNKVRQGWTGTDDDGAGITVGVKTAWSYGKSSARAKRITLVKPIIKATGPITLGLALDTDFEDRTGITAQASFSQNIALWNTAIWNQAYWSGGQTMTNKWKSVNHRPGAAFSLRMLAVVKGLTGSWQATQFILEDGGLLG